MQSATGRKTAEERLKTPIKTALTPRQQLAMDIGVRLEVCRVVAGTMHSQTAAAEKIGVTKAAYSGWVLGKNQVSITAAQLMSELAGVQISYILTGDTSGMGKAKRAEMEKFESQYHEYQRLRRVFGW